MEKLKGHHRKNRTTTKEKRKKESQGKTDESENFCQWSMNRAGKTEKNQPFEQNKTKRTY